MKTTHNVAAFLPTVSRSLDVGDFGLSLAETPDAGVAYLIEYGFSQAIADTQAVGAAGLVAAAVKAGVIGKEDGEAAGGKEATKGTLAKFLATTDVPGWASWQQDFLAARAQDRLDAIKAGEMVFGSAERLSPEERERRAVIDSTLSEFAKEQGMKLPKKAEELAPLREFIYSAKKAEIDAEVNRRLKSGGKTATGIDAGALLALMKG